MPDSKIILITGTSRGIGRSLAEHYIESGATVVGCSRSETTIENAQYLHVTLDVSEEAQVKHLFGQIRNEYGRLDVLINNAGTASMNLALTTPMTTVDSVLDTNVKGTFLFCREAARLMIRKGHGRIVNLVTVATPFKLEGEAIYAASKAAVISLTQILAKEFGHFGITVNAVGPTVIPTDLIKSVPDEKIQELIDRQTIKRHGNMGDVANVIDFFIRPESDFVTGQIVFLGGA